jgi:hypothetical protein
MVGRSFTENICPRTTTFHPKWEFLKCEWEAHVCAAFSPFAPFSGGLTLIGKGVVFKTTVSDGHLRVRASHPPPNSLTKLLCGWSLVLSRFVPIGRFALRTNPWLPIGALTGHPFMGAATAFISLLLDRDQRHDSGNILLKDILST